MERKKRENISIVKLKNHQNRLLQCECKEVKPEEEKHEIPTNQTAIKMITDLKIIEVA